MENDNLIAILNEISDMADEYDLPDEIRHQFMGIILDAYQKDRSIEIIEIGDIGIPLDEYVSGLTKDKE